MRMIRLRGKRENTKPSSVAIANMLAESVWLLLSYDQGPLPPYHSNHRRTTLIKTWCHVVGQLQLQLHHAPTHRLTDSLFVVSPFLLFLSPFLRFTVTWRSWEPTQSGATFSSLFRQVDLVEKVRVVVVMYRGRQGVRKQNHTPLKNGGL
jgi:hypothetical protein